MPPSGSPHGGPRKPTPRSRPAHSRGKPAEHALIIFAKAPIPGQVKTRLCPPLSEDEAASLQGSLVMDILERSKTLRRIDRYLACAPTAEHPFFLTMAARFGVQLWEQVGSDLGQRMHQALTTAFHKGYRKALVIGSDIPTFSAQSCSRAIDLLNHYDVVYGPTSDGGYYLIGMKNPVPELFLDIPWSTPSVLSTSLERALQLRLSVGHLELQHDLDTIEDLQFMVIQLHGPGKKNFSSRTSNVLLALAGRHLGKPS